MITDDRPWQRSGLDTLKAGMSVLMGVRQVENFARPHCAAEAGRASMPMAPRASALIGGFTKFVTVTKFATKFRESVHPTWDETGFVSCRPRLSGAPPRGGPAPYRPRAAILRPPWRGGNDVEAGAARRARTDCPLQACPEVGHAVPRPRPAGIPSSPRLVIIS
jgi:hypothetical protein